MKSKRGQLTIFIILALVLIFVIIVLLINRGDFISIFKFQSPVEEISECSQNYLEEGIKMVSVQGGVIVPENYFLYQDNKVEYLCYTDEDYRACKVQKPLLKKSIESELEDYVAPKIKECLESVRTALEKKGSSMTFKGPEISVQLLPNNVFLEVVMDLQITEQESIESYKSIKTDVTSNLYEFSAIASKISNDEVTFGDTETLTYMLSNKPWLKIEKKKQSEGTKIYTLINRENENEFWFATRSFAMPPGALK